MSELRLTIGLPGSGKSSYAEQLLSLGNYVAGGQDWRRINWDNMRKDRGMHLRDFNRAEEEVMQKWSFAQAEEWGKMGLNVIVDNTNLNENTRNKWKGVAQRAGMTYTEIPMGATLEECIERDSRRTGVDQCGRAVIERMALFAGLIKFDPAERLVLVDMDGTLFDGSHRSPYSDEVADDKPRYPIIALVHLFEQADYTILIVSGRKLSAGKQSVACLGKHLVRYQHIFMRQNGDNRPDNIIKKEILDKLPKDQISYVLDDRDQVVQMWRQEGLTCLQVADGNF